jgi:hypothetical protein
MPTSRQISTFWRNILPPSSGPGGSMFLQMFHTKLQQHKQRPEISVKIRKKAVPSPES